MVSKVVVDTSALIEYVNGSEEGEVVRDFIENKENIVLIPSIVIGEFVSKLEREGIRSDEIIKNLDGYTISVSVNAELCVKAGKRHAKMRKAEPDISLVDCVIMELAEENKNAMILTTDKHFKHYKNARII